MASDVRQLFSKRAEESPPPPEYARFNAPGAIVFGGGLPDASTYPTAAFSGIIGELLTRNDSATYSYSYEAGDRDLRAAIARRARRNGVDIGEDGVILTNGCSGALELAALATLNPGDVVITEAMSYPMAIKLFVAQGARIETVPLNEDGLDADALGALAVRLAQAGTPAKMLYTIAGAQSPTGTVLPAEIRQRVVAIARHHGFLILQDDTYGEIRYEADLPPPFVALAPERTIHAGSFSKTLAPGLRAGWMMTDPEIAKAIVRVRTDLGTTPIVQRAIAQMLGDARYDRHLAAVTALYRQKRDVLDAALRASCGDAGVWQVPRAGFFVWFRPARKDLNTLVEQAANAGVTFLPGPYFAARPDARDGDATHGIRLAFGQLPRDQIALGIERLATALHGTKD